MRKFDLHLKIIKMIKHELKNDQLHISIENKDFSYRIPLAKIEDLINWKVGKNPSNSIIIKNVSKWTLKLFTNNFTTIEHVKQFKGIVKQYAPENTIDWIDTEKAVNIQSHYSNLTLDLKKENPSEEAIIAKLKKKYQID
jgi:hypothetical protein